MILVNWPNRVEPPKFLPRRRTCPACSDADFEVTWFGGPVCFCCAKPTGVPC